MFDKLIDRVADKMLDRLLVRRQAFYRLIERPAKAQILNVNVAHRNLTAADIQRQQQMWRGRQAS